MNCLPLSVCVRLDRFGGGQLAVVGNLALITMHGFLSLHATAGHGAGTAVTSLPHNKDWRRFA